MAKDSSSWAHASGPGLFCHLLVSPCFASSRSGFVARPAAALGTTLQGISGSSEMASEASVPQQGGV